MTVNEGQDKRHQHSARSIGHCRDARPALREARRRQALKPPASWGSLAVSRGCSGETGPSFTLAEQMAHSGTDQTSSPRPDGKRTMVKTKQTRRGRGHRETLTAPRICPTKKALPHPVSLRCAAASAQTVHALIRLLLTAPAREVAASPRTEEDSGAQTRDSSMRGHTGLQVP